jgi:regulator of cell morphogenesis and NO signaling
MTPELRPDSTVGEIVARDGRTASVFTRHQIDFCCGGRQTLAQACASKHLDVDVIVRELSQSVESADPDADVTGWSATRLIDWIVNRHHAYVRAEIPAIISLLDRTVARHGAAHPELAEIRARFGIEHPIAAMRMEHDDAALQLAHIRRLASGYLAPPDACRTWQTAYAQLAAFEADLHRHVHLENEVLFPLALHLLADRVECTP